MTVKQAKKIIFYEVATNGVVTSKAIKLFIENRISKQTFDEIIIKAKIKYEEAKKEFMSGRKHNVISITFENTKDFYKNIE